MSDAWIGFLVAVSAIGILAAAWCLHLKMIVDDIIRSEKKRLRELAEQHARELAMKMLKDLLRNLRITFPVELINESDIDWGENKSRKEDAA